MGVGQLLELSLMTVLSRSEAIKQNIKSYSISNQEIRKLESGNKGQVELSVKSFNQLKV